jgi:hypothetical protein
VSRSPKAHRTPRRAHVDAGLAPISHESASPLSMRDSGGPLALDASGRWTYPYFTQANAPARRAPPGAGNRR